MDSNLELFPQTVPKMLRSMYVDDMICGCDDEVEAYQLYVESTHPNITSMDQG